MYTSNEEVFLLVYYFIIELFTHSLYEQDAFWSLDRLMSDDKYAMHGNYIGK